MVRITFALLLVALAETAVAQTPPPPATTFNRSVWDGLFEAASVRQVPANRLYDMSGYHSFLVDSEMISTNWLACHHYNADGGGCGFNAVVADLFYSAPRRRVAVRSLFAREVDDPAEFGCGRAPGTYPNHLDFYARNDWDHVVCIIGSQQWTQNGFSNYTNAIWLLERGGFQFRTTTGDAQAATRMSIADAAVTVQAPLTATVPGGNVPFNVRRVDVDVEGFSATVSCAPTEIVISGGGSCDRGSFRLNRPNGNGWEVVCHESGLNRVVAFCASY